MKSVACVFVAVLLMSAVTMGVKNTGDKVGVKVSVSQNALTYFKDQLLPLAEQAALTSVIPDMTERVHVPVVGGVDLTLKNMKLNRLSVQNSSIILNSGNSIAVGIVGLNVDITLNWHYREVNWPHISDSGSGEGSTTRAGGNIVFSLGSDATGHPTAVITSCGLDLSTLSIKLHGGASWLYDAIINMFHKKIIESLDKGVCKALTTDAQAAISQFLTQAPVQHDLGFHLAMSEQFHHFRYPHHHIHCKEVEWFEHLTIFRVSNHHLPLKRNQTQWQLKIKILFS